MATIEQQLTELVNQKNALATNLNTKGVMASAEETLNTLVPKVLDIETGGGGDSGGEYLVRVIDYDGTVLKQDHLDTGATFELPAAPTNHSRLVFQEWSSPVTITDNTITVGNSDITIGATYKTASGLTEIDITLTKVTGLAVTCNMVGNKNWGDGTTDSATSHTYTNYGNYTITCDGTSIPDGTSSNGGGMFSSAPSARNYYCTNIRIGELVTSIGNYAFQSCSSLTSITIPNGVTSMGSSAFRYCLLLTSITIPDSVTSIGDYAFYSCYSLTSITIPDSVTSIGKHVFGTCYSLTSITIPDSVTSIGDYAFYSCYSLTSITIPDSVTSIGKHVFGTCYSLTSITILGSVTSIGSNAFQYCSSKKYNFTRATSVPTLANTGAFTGINGICKIYVPDALYDSWIAATNWVTYADYIYKTSEMEG